MRTHTRALPYLSGALLGALLTVGAPRLARAQMSQRGQPTTPFAVADFAKLHWLEGSWAGTAPGEQPVYQRIHFVDDSTADITYFRDSSFTQEAATGRIYLSVGRVYHSFGPNRWGATHVGADGVFLVPQTGARNTYSWTFKGPDEWTATTRTGLSGQPRVTIYDFKRAK